MRIVHKNLCSPKEDEGREEEPICAGVAEELFLKTGRDCSSGEGIQTLQVISLIGRQIFGRKKKNVEISWV